MSNIGHTKLGRLSANAVRKVPFSESNGHGPRFVKDGRIEGDVEVEIDWDFIRRFMVPRALRSKSKRCKDGPLVVIVRNTKHIRE